MSDEQAAVGRDAPQADARALQAALLTSTDPDERYDLLHELGHAGGSAQASSVEPLLAAKSDPMLARLALEVLCLHWGLGERYRNAILEFIRGVTWDEEEDVRQIAIYAAGRLLKQKTDPELVAALIGVAELSEAESLVQDDALLALGRALGYDREDLPRLSRGSGLLSDVAGEILARARRVSGGQVDW